MIDIESQIFTRVSDALRRSYPEVSIESVTTFTPSVFPCVCIEETDNYPLRETQSSSSNENHVVAVFEVNVYSNRAVGKKAEAKTILTIVDEEMLTIGFTRTTRNPINLDDATKYRLFARYSGVVSSKNIIYRR